MAWPERRSCSFNAVGGSCIGSRVLRLSAGELSAKHREFTFQHCNVLAKLIVVEFHEYTRGFVGELCQHRAFVVTEVITSRMWPIERNRHAPQLVTDRDGNDRLH